MSHYIDPALLAKQKAGIPLTGDEARSMVGGLQKCIEEKTRDHKDATLMVLMLSAVGSRYFEDVWDMLLLEGVGDAQEDPGS